MRLMIAYGLIAAFVALAFWLRYNGNERKHHRQIIRDREHFEASDFRKRLQKADEEAKRAR